MAGLKNVCPFQAQTSHADFSIPVIQTGMNRPRRTRTVGGVGGAVAYPIRLHRAEWQITPGGLRQMQVVRQATPTKRSSIQ